MLIFKDFVEPASLVTNTRYIEVIAVIDYVSFSSTFRIRNGLLYLHKFCGDSALEIEIR